MNENMKLIIIALALCQMTISVSTSTAQDTAQDTLQRFSESDFTFDLSNAHVESSGTGGTIQVANVATFPALYGHGISYVLFNIEPCGINLPHVHPRATEMLYLVSGSNLTVGFTEENGGRLILNNLEQGEATFFPQGYIHYQQNFGCETATYLSALNSEDPGVITVANNLVRIPSESLKATLGIDDVVGISIPAGPAPGRDPECLQRCGIISQTTMYPYSTDLPNNSGGKHGSGGRNNKP